MKKSFIESFERELFEAVNEDNLLSTFWLNVEGTNKKLERKGIKDELALEEILNFISKLSPEEKDCVSLEWRWDEVKPGDAGGDLIVSVYGPSEINPGDDRTMTNWGEAEDKIIAALETEDFEEDEEEYSSSYYIVVEGTNKEQRKDGIADEDALEEILEFIGDLNFKERENVTLYWNWDEEAGDGEGDVVVSVYGPSERANFVTDEAKVNDKEWTLSNWDYAEKQIRRLLGLSRK